MVLSIGPGTFGTGAYAAEEFLLVSIMLTGCCLGIFVVLICFHWGEEAV